MRGVVYIQLFSVRLVYFIRDAGGGGDDVEVEFALDALLDDLHVQQPQKAAAEAEAEGDGGIRLKDERGVVELQFEEGVLQIVEPAAV